ncbi:BgTH12-07287 [Blumeria graminis f. sp. triticale]|uniref:BgTH12-07287 n=1 Tax=Blumeria graminis f. sp. triticale TaxID=1689686 RepID=A0A9W4GIL1_BLUGR|nr:BgTH12-07287 [Blumeria graminis f. sp. triticale]
MASNRKSLDASKYSGISAAAFEYNNCINKSSHDFHLPNQLPLEDYPLFPSDWDEISTYETNLYPTSLLWDSPKPKIEYQPPPNFSTMNPLTTAQQEKLRSVAMPHSFQYRGHHSPHSTESSKSHSISSPETNESSRKRKTLAEAEDEEDEDSNPLVKKTAHNMIEKRYRTNLNDKIAALRDSVPSLRIISKSARGEDTLDDREELQGLTPAHKLNKATVLSKATEYICHLEKRNKRLQQENNEQKARLDAFERLFRHGSMDFHPPQTVDNPFQFTPEYNMPGTPPVTVQQAMIQAPDETRRSQSQNHQNPYQQPQEIYAQNQQPMLSAGWSSHPYMGKLMVGTLAGFMIMEGFSEVDQDVESPASRGLFAIPTSMLGSLRSAFHSLLEINLFGYHVPALETFWYLKIIMILSGMLYALLPLFIYSTPKSHRSKFKSAFLAAAPSLASPIQVRRQAWLTAIQTVWVPRHNFFLEAAALCLKMAKLSTRNIVGSQGYTYLTGITEQREAARIQAWTIALDAQLAGGDVEVNKSRLTLTLLASETLPDTPARLMLKALHIRVLLWEVGNAGFHGYYLFQEFAAKLARWKWNKAKQLHQLSTYLKEEQQDSLPDYLVALLQQNCDDVLVDSIGQRAYNLAWNFPTTNNTCNEADFMDAVVDDFAIRSPLDAVASWFSCLVLQRALSKSLEDNGSKTSNEKLIIDDLNLAIRTAPTGSGSHIRALVARAVLVSDKRGASIAEAMQFLGPLDKHVGKKTSAPNFINTSTSMASFPEVKLSLRCAMAIAHIERCPAPSIPERALHVINTISPRNLTLLGFTATFKLMENINGHSLVAASCTNSLERLAGGLRIWVGGKEGEKSGLPITTKVEIVKRCLAITKRIIGMQDAGYASMSEDDEDENP